MSSEDDQDVCWICLCASEGGKGLEAVCGCPRQCHPDCLARWQLQQAGRREERYCRFCEQEYPDWKNALTPREIKPTTPIMAVSVRGRVHKLRVRPGPEGKEDFKRQVRQLLGYSDDMEFDVIFECKTPHSGEKVQLQGFSAFDAATHCAAVSAAKRLKNKQQQKQQHKHHRQLGPDDVSSRSDDVAAQQDGSIDGSSAGRSSDPGDAGRHQPRVAASIAAHHAVGAATTAAAVASGALPTDISRLQAQYQLYMQQRQQHLSGFGLPSSARLAPAAGGNSSSIGRPAAVSPTSRTSSGSSEGWGLVSNSSGASALMSAEAAAAAAAGLAQLPGASRSVSSASADASAMLTAGGSSSAGAAAVPAGHTDTCPLPAYSLLATAGAPAASGVTPSIANDGVVYDPSIACRSFFTEPLPAVQYSDELLQPHSPTATASAAGPSAAAAAAGLNGTGDGCGSDSSARKVSKFTRWFQRITTRRGEQDNSRKAS